MKRRAIKLVILSIWAANLLLLALPQGTKASGNFRYDTKVTYRVATDGTTQVTQNYTITNLTNRFYLTEIKLTTPTDNVQGLIVKYGDGTAINASTEKQSASKGDLKYDFQQIHISFPRQDYGLGRSWQFIVTYTASGLVETKGAAHTVYVPSIESDADDDYQATVDVPAEYGTPHFSGAKAGDYGSSSGRNFYSFSKTDLVQHSLALAFGDTNTYKLNFNFPLHNDSPFPRTLTITLPPDLNNQKVYINHLTPAPAGTRLDDDGNILADYHLGPHQSLAIQTDISGEVHYLDYALALSGNKAGIPANLVSRYTKATQYWPTDGAVGQAAKKITDDQAPVINNVKAMYQFVIDKLSYNKDKIKFNIRQGAAKALLDPNNAVCLEYSDLLIAMLRSQGIPARMVVGYGYSGSLKASSSVTDSLHAWVEAYVPGIGWMTLDPTWGEKFDQFGKSDLDHFAFAVWGEKDSAPDAVMAGSKDLDYQYENTTLAYGPKVTPAPPAVRLQAKRLVLLPFVALDLVTATAPAQIPTDNNYIFLNSQKIALGSLAPSQTSRLQRFEFGKAWGQLSTVSFVRAGTDSALTLASVSTKPDYRPMSILLTLALIVAACLIMVRLRPHNNQTRQS